MLVLGHMKTAGRFLSFSDKLQSLYVFHLVNACLHHTNPTLPITKPSTNIHTCAYMQAHT